MGYGWALCISSDRNIQCLSVITHKKREKHSYEAQHLRKRRCVQLGEELLKVKHLSQYHLDSLIDDAKTNMKSGLLSIQSKNVTRQIKDGAKKQITFTKP